MLWINDSNQGDGMRMAAVPHPAASNDKSGHIKNITEWTYSTRKADCSLDILAV